MLNCIIIVVIKEFIMDYKKLEGFRGELRDLNDAVCSECKNITKVPFKPDGIRPIYCRDCYKKRKSRKF